MTRTSNIGKSQNFQMNELNQLQLNQLVVPLYTEKTSQYETDLPKKYDLPERLN